MPHRTPIRQFSGAAFVRVLVVLQGLAIVAGLIWVLLQREERCVMSPCPTLCFGTGVLDILNRTGRRPPGAERPDAEKSDSDGIDYDLGGGAWNIASALSRAGEPVVPALVTGPDPLGNFLMDLVRNDFPQARRIASGARTRISVIEPAGADGQARTATVRHPIDHDATFQALSAILESEKPARLLIAPTSAADNPLVEWVLDAFEGEVVLSLSMGQCADDPIGTLKLARRARLVGLNASEARALTGFARPEDAMFALVEQGVESVFCTDGLAGLCAWERNGKPAKPEHAPAFRIKTPGLAIGCGDEAFAAYIHARLNLGIEVAEATRLASAAGALRFAGMPFQSWSELQEFADTAPVHRVIPAKPVRSQPLQPAAQPTSRQRLQLPKLLAAGGAVCLLVYLAVYQFPQFIGA